MIHLRWPTWRRDLLVGILASIVTASVLVPIGWAALREQTEAARHSAREAEQRADEKAAEADEQRAQARRILVEQAADFAGFPLGANRSEAEALEVTTAAVTPEIPEGAYVLVDKKATSYAAGDIVIYHVGANNYLGRVVAVDKAAGRLTVGRNGEKNREVAAADVVGRGVLNTR